MCPRARNTVRAPPRVPRTRLCVFASPRQLSPPRRSELVEELRALERALDFELCVLTASGGRQETHRGGGVMARGPAVNLCVMF